MPAAANRLPEGVGRQLQPAECGEFADVMGTAPALGGTSQDIPQHVFADQRDTRRDVAHALQRLITRDQEDDRQETRIDSLNSPYTFRSTVT